ncbi:hypothetical protein EDB85DRAFT_1984868 [Lactarius pseudohatsudake]|nr:hypothetical protein EDB85DRAFT_1984868 [Lactarius pseudohatsudake]
MEWRFLCPSLVGASWVVPEKHFVLRAFAQSLLACRVSTSSRASTSISPSIDNAKRLFSLHLSPCLRAGSHHHPRHVSSTGATWACSHEEPKQRCCIRVCLYYSLFGNQTSVEVRPLPDSVLRGDSDLDSWRFRLTFSGAFSAWNLPPRSFRSLKDYTLYDSECSMPPLLHRSGRDWPTVPQYGAEKNRKVAHCCKVLKTLHDMVQCTTKGTRK